MSSTEGLLPPPPAPSPPFLISGLFFRLTLWCGSPCVKTEDAPACRALLQVFGSCRIPELRDTKSTNTAQGLPWASGNSSQLSNTRTTEIQKFLWIKPPAWYKPNLQEPLIIQILGSIHNPWEEPCLEQAVLLSPFTKT